MNNKIAIKNYQIHLYVQVLPCLPGLPGRCPLPRWGNSSSLGARARQEGNNDFLPEMLPPSEWLCNESIISTVIKIISLLSSHHYWWIFPQWIHSNLLKHEIMDRLRYGGGGSLVKFSNFVLKKNCFLSKLISPRMKSLLLLCC